MFGLLEILLVALLDVIILEGLSLATKEKNFDATQLSLAVKMSVSTSLRNCFRFFFLFHVWPSPADRLI